MKEFAYYNILFNKFEELYNQYKQINKIYSIRQTTGIEDDALAEVLDFFSDSMADLCCYNNVEGFFDGFLDFVNDNGTTMSSYDSEVSYQVDTVEDLFDFYFAYYLESNLIHIIETYLTFGSETKDALLFLCYDNDYINLMYSDEQLDSICSYINQYITENELDENGNIYCWYDGEAFSIEDHRYTSIEESKGMTRCIKHFCEEAGIDYDTYDFV